MLDPHQLLRVKERLDKRKAVAKHDAYMRERRGEVLIVLAKNLPKQDNMKKRSDTIEKLADNLTELFDKYYV